MFERVGEKKLNEGDTDPRKSQQCDPPNRCGTKSQNMLLKEEKSRWHMLSCS